jgi:O-antigen/teichoic acid export membrane protein
MIRNSLANFIGRLWAFLSNYLFIPFYIKILGIEQFSIIAFSLVIVSFIAFLDLGLTPTLARELQDAKKSNQQRVNLLHSYEICYGGILLTLILLSLLIPDHWYMLLDKKTTISSNNFPYYIRLIILLAASQMLFNFYQSGLFGIAQQVKANIVQIFLGLFRNGLIIPIIIIYPNLGIFFSWQILITLLAAVSARYILYNKLTVNFNLISYEFSWKAILNNRAFIQGMFLISIVAAINSQLDKLLVSQLISLNSLAEYSLATTIAQLAILVITPITMAFSPRIIYLFTSNQEKKSRLIFFFSFRLINVFSFSIGAMIAFYGSYLLAQWTGKPELATHADSYLWLLAFGFSFLAVLIIPFNVAIAHKNTKFNNLLGIASLILTIPFYYLGIQYYGLKGAALVWFWLHLIITPIYIYWININFIKMRYFQDLTLRGIILPLLIILLVFSVFSNLIPLNDLLWENLLKIMLITIIALSAGLLSSFSPKEIYKSYWDLKD